MLHAKAAHLLSAILQSAVILVILTPHNITLAHYIDDVQIENDEQEIVSTANALVKLSEPESGRYRPHEKSGVCRLSDVSEGPRHSCITTTYHSKIGTKLGRPF